MKRLFLLIAALCALVSVSAMADGYAVRYHTSYSNWDSSFNRHYTYTERTVHTSCGYHTCYSGYSSNSNVYVEETIVTGGSYDGYTRVQVYNNARYHDNDRHVTYYTHRHNGRRRVVRRHYHRSHSHIHSDYYYNTHYHHRVNYVVLDEFTAQIILGMEFVNLGATVLSACDSDDGACIALGLASSASGLASSISASVRENRKTELQRAIENENKEVEEDDMEDILK
jgi:hypothetical protein